MPERLGTPVIFKESPLRASFALSRRIDLSGQKLSNGSMDNSGEYPQTGDKIKTDPNIFWSGVHIKDTYNKLPQELQELHLSVAQHNSDPQEFVPLHFTPEAQDYKTGLGDVVQHWGDKQLILDKDNPDVVMYDLYSNGELIARVIQPQPGEDQESLQPEILVSNKENPATHIWTSTKTTLVLGALLHDYKTKQKPLNSNTAVQPYTGFSLSKFYAKFKDQNFLTRKDQN